MKTLRIGLRSLGFLGGIAVVCGTIGCQAPHARQPVKTEPEKVQPTAPQQFTGTPVKINRVNTDLRFVVLDFSSRAMPPLGTKLTVFRNGSPVGLIQLTAPVRGQFATADILEGILLVGDEVR